ncbi:hypothetical protein JHK84_040014 [Glycine max]|nr:hypothetical protein JHK86_039801 [Glycine max]KAG5121674.1 hypothetical protein JHK84_040014 [Glycine max]
MRRNLMTSNAYSNITQLDIHRDEYQRPTDTTQHDQFVGYESSDSSDDDVNMTQENIDIGIRLAEKETIHLCLTEIENMLQVNIRSLRDFPSMPYPIGYAPNQHHNNLIHNEMAYDKEMLAEQYYTAYQLLTAASKFVYGSKKSITIHHGLSKSTKWPLTIHHDIPVITQPWFNLIHEKYLRPGDEVVFYYRFHDHAWELLIRKAIEWNNSNTDHDFDD